MQSLEERNQNTFISNQIELLDNLIANTKNQQLTWQINPIPMEQLNIVDRYGKYHVNRFVCDISNNIIIEIVFDPEYQHIKIIETLHKGLTELNAKSKLVHYMSKDMISHSEVYRLMNMLFEVIMTLRRASFEKELSQLNVNLNKDSHQQMSNLNLCLEGLNSLFASMNQENINNVDINNPMFKLAIHE